VSSGASSTGRTPSFLERAADLVRPLVPPESWGHRALAPIARRLGVSRKEAEPSDPRSRLIAEFARCYPRAFFVQVGSNDGLKLDPLRHHILTRQWSGIMIEPVPYVFEQLAAQYGNHPRIILENVAIADHDGVAELYYLPQSADESLPDWYDALATFRKDVLLKHDEFIPDIATRISSIEVPCLTFETLCARNGVKNVDLVQIDTEGYDAEVIRLIDLERHAPTLIMFEHLHLAPDDWHACLDRLRRHGYQDASDHMDTICLNVRSLPRRRRRLRRIWHELGASASGAPA
jgi:FkbM family methyltransferase